MRLALAADREARADRDHHAVVLKMLARRFHTFSEDERLEIYHDAWERMLRKQRDGEQIQSPRRYLLETSYHDALHVATRRDRAEVAVAPNSRLLAELQDEGESIEERVVILDEARIARELIATLESRQRSVFKLRWDLGLDAREVRDALGLTRRQYLRIAEEGARAIAERVTELHDGTWSARQRSLLTASLLRVTVDGERRAFASEARRAEAQRLLSSDPHVAALFAEVERVVGRAAALLPLPAVAGDQSGTFARVADAATAARAQLGDWAATGKQHATSAYVRASDPTPLAGARPGTAAAAIAGCLAISGGATYCAVEGVPEGLRGTLGIERSEEAKPLEASKPKRARPAEIATEPVVPQIPPPAPEPPPAPAPEPAPAPAPQPTPAPEPAPPPPAPAEQNFGIEQSSPAPSSQPAPAPAPAPASGGSGGEFGFER